MHVNQLILQIMQLMLLIPSLNKKLCDSLHKSIELKNIFLEYKMYN